MVEKPVKIQKEAIVYLAAAGKIPKDKFYVYFTSNYKNPVNESVFEEIVTTLIREQKIVYEDGNIYLVSPVYKMLALLPGYDYFNTRMGVLDMQMALNPELQKTVNVAEPYIRYHYNDGGGNEGNLVLFPKTREVVLYGYDNESRLNFFPERIENQKVFNHLPERLKNVILSDSFVWEWDRTGEVWGTNCFWFTGGLWECDPDWGKQVQWNHDDGGIKYTLKHFLPKPEGIL